MSIYGVIKRVFDLLFSALGIVILSPVLLLVSALIFVFMGRPILFRQVRPGKGNKPFAIYKFRTMTEALDRSGNPLPDEERLTPVGRVLRKTSMDELPELINVLRGDMSLVGPRPLLMEYIPLYSEEQARRHEVRPGVTGLAQVMGRNAIDWDEKFGYDIYYVENIGFFLDLKILFMTLFSVFTGSGVNRSDGTPMPKFTGNRPAKRDEANL